MKALLLALVLPLLQAGSPATTEAPAPVLTAEEEARAQDLMREIRCAACENEPISQSAADIAGNMRARVRVMVAEGASDQEVRDWFAERYGEFVLFRPEAKGPGGVVLWIGPFALLMLGAGAIWALSRRRRAAADIAPVAPEDTGD